MQIFLEIFFIKKFQIILIRNSFRDSFGNFYESDGDMPFIKVGDILNMPIKK